MKAGKRRQAFAILSFGGKEEEAHNQCAGTEFPGSPSYTDTLAKQKICKGIIL